MFDYFEHHSMEEIHRMIGKEETFFLLFLFELYRDVEK